MPQEDLPTFLKVAERLQVKILVLKPSSSWPWQSQVKGLIERVASEDDAAASEAENVDANMEIEEEEDADHGFEEETKIEEESDEDEEEEEEEEEMVNDLLAKSLGADAAKKEAEQKVSGSHWLHEDKLAKLLFSDDFSLLDLTT